MSIFDFIYNLLADDEIVKIPHIHQIGTKSPSYTYVVLDQEYKEEELYQHPSVLTYPEFFEVIVDIIPEDAQGLIFQLPEIDPIEELQTKVDALTADVELLKK